MFRLVVYVIALVVYLVISFKNIGWCFLNKDYFNNLFFFKKTNLSCFIKVPINIFYEDTVSLKYQVNTCMQYHINDSFYLFLKDSVFKSHYHHDNFFKNTLSIGYGYSILNGFIYFSYLEFAPSLYYVTAIPEKNNLKILIYTSAMYSYQLINNIYYIQHLETLSNFQHITTKFETAISFLCKGNTISCKCSYSILINENKFNHILPNIDKYISLSFSYFL